MQAYMYKRKVGDEGLLKVRPFSGKEVIVISMDEPEKSSHRRAEDEPIKVNAHIRRILDDSE